MATSSKAGTKQDTAFDPKLVRELAEILRETELTEIEVERDGLRMYVARTVQAAPVQHVAAAPVAAAPVAAPAPSAAPAAPAASGGAPDNAVPSPMVGTVYLRPNPDADEFAKIGDAVKEGDTILLVEAMKTFNPIIAPKSGKLTAMLVEDGQPIEFGEPLFVID
ncbi:acetyl-CoA carboxylase biotin carboxyl carrier protein [Hyphobacterium sp. HN65]|uniref:Biotin carboxyl carrier protein of acetyl-CoA carboxylase n=1 Tax=Hyphobacterium lacteum TaxID=3116575 RepID=A0ABU7LLK6_9PROT|nr:acetyl-CoA carboxylase biotin carboxyl carrier protein [Hyphobacterium sp. HN65]MEE2524810.1 acetyl-CoA carboxylase biotin carboxyl carrier protein [Hyphobacterium sp. HN65]